MKKYLMILLFMICSSIYSKECVIEQKITYLLSGTTYYSFLCSDKTVITLVEMEKFYSLKEKEVYIYKEEEEKENHIAIFFIILLILIGLFGFMVMCFS